MLAFRPYPLLTLLTLPALGFLLWLGSWQLDRRAWKQDLLADYAQTAQASPIDLTAALCAGGAVSGQLVQVEALTPLAGEIRVYGRNERGAPGWRVFAPVQAPACAAAPLILMETGFSPLETATRADDSPVRDVAERNRLRFETPAAAGPFTPASDPVDNAFFAFEAEGMAQVLSQDPAALNPDWWIARSDGEPPLHLTQTPPERHLAYAITWFCMTLALLAVYLAFHIKAGRLTRR